MVVAMGSSTRTPLVFPQCEWGLTWQSATGRVSAATQPATNALPSEAQQEPWYRGPLTIAVPSVGAALRQVYVQTDYPAAQYGDSSLATVWTDRVQEVVDWLLPVLRAQASSSFVYVTRVEVEGFVDPEEDFEEVSITQWVQLSPEQAMDYWDRLGLAIQERTDLLPEYLQELASERVGVRVAWQESDRGL